MACAEKYIIWLRNLYKEIGYEPKKAMILYGDNKSAIAIVTPNFTNELQLLAYISRGTRRRRMRSVPELSEVAHLFSLLPPPSLVQRIARHHR